MAEGEHERASKKHGIALGEHKGASREHGRAKREHIDETGVSRRRPQNQLWITISFGSGNLYKDIYISYTYNKY